MELFGKLEKITDENVVLDVSSLDKILPNIPFTYEERKKLVDAWNSKTQGLEDHDETQNT